MKRTATRCTLLGFLVGLSASPACNERTTHEDTCYPPDPWVDFEGHPYERGFCDYDTVPQFEELPEGVNSETFGFCFDLEPGQACDGCPIEDTKQFLIDAYIEHKECQDPVVDNIGECSHRTLEGSLCCTSSDCDAVVVDFIRGCYSLSDDGKQCCYQAMIASPCAGKVIR